jgi:tetratricopeptide (TPR) repeat protein
LGEIVIPLARALAMSGDYAPAQKVLQAHPDIASGNSQSYSATEDFIAGMKSLESHAAIAAVEQLTRSDQEAPRPETSFFLAQAEMQQEHWGPAIQALNKILGNKRGTTVIDSVASLIPLAEYDLSVCYAGLGQRSEAEAHFTAASKTIWRDADPQLKATIEASTNAAATKALKDSKR